MKSLFEGFTTKFTTTLDILHNLNQNSLKKDP